MSPRSAFLLVAQDLTGLQARILAKQGHFSYRPAQVKTLCRVLVNLQYPFCFVPKPYYLTLNTQYPKLETQVCPRVRWRVTCYVCTCVCRRFLDVPLRVSFKGFDKLRLVSLIRGSTLVGLCLGFRGSGVQGFRGLGFRV